MKNTSFSYSFHMEWILESQVKQKQPESVLLLDYNMDYDMKGDNYSTFCL